jgi:hypothetical protein
MGKRPFVICFVIYPPFLNYLLRTVFFYKWHGDCIDISPLITDEATMPRISSQERLHQMDMSGYGSEYR